MADAYRSYDKKIDVQKISVGSHQSIGSVERYHQALGAQTRVLLETVTSKCGVQIEPFIKICVWAVRHAGWLLNNYHIRSDGSTAQEIVDGKPA